MSAHQLYGGPLEGTVIMTPGKHFPAELRVTRKEESMDVITIHVYGLNRGHAADPTRQPRPAYHYSHTVTI